MPSRAWPTIGERIADNSPWQAKVILACSTALICPYSTEAVGDDLGNAADLIPQAVLQPTAQLPWRLQCPCSGSL